MNRLNELRLDIAIAVTIKESVDDNEVVKAFDNLITLLELEKDRIEYGQNKAR